MTTNQSNGEARQKFRDSVGFQFQFVLHSGLEVSQAIDHVCIAADKLQSQLAGEVLAEAERFAITGLGPKQLRDLFVRLGVKLEGQ